MLTHDSLREFLPARRLSQDLAGHLVERAGRRMENGQSQAGWRDLNQAVRLGAGEAQISHFRTQQATARLARAIDELARGDIAAAKLELERMDQRNLGGADRRAWQAVALQMETADQRAARGDAATAVESFERAQRMLPESTSPGAAAVAAHLQQRLEHLHATARVLHELDARLHAALAKADWTEVLAAADALLELAPQHSAARQARHKAWQIVGLEVTQPHRPAKNRAFAFRDWQPAASTNARRNAKVDTVRERQQGKRLVAWIDAVGGFLVCLGDEVVLGQPSEGGDVDVPILADLSRRHAVIRREGEAYVLTPLMKTMVDGKVVADPTVLRDKCAIKLGDAVELRFRKPHALSSTAVLEILTHHKTEPAVDGIVLMSESCILGPQPHSHVRCRDWASDLVLFRRGAELMCRTHTPIEVDGQTCVGQATLDGNCRIESEEFALSLEEI
jgi:tetratricopeptide (TPR) repeat protein